MSMPPRHWQRQRMINLFYLLILDVAFLISNHFKNQRRGFDWDSRRKEKGAADVLYSELGGKRADA